MCPTPSPTYPARLAPFQFHPKPSPTAGHQLRGVQQQRQVARWRRARSSFGSATSSASTSTRISASSSMSVGWDSPTSSCSRWSGCLDLTTLVCRITLLQWLRSQPVRYQGNHEYPSMEHLGNRRQPVEFQDASSATPYSINII